MIARMWRGGTRAEDAEAYAGYVARTGIAAYAATPGNRGSWLLCRIEGDLAEFLTLSLWDSLDAVRAFAGEDVERAVFYPEDDHWLIERDPLARHYLVAAASAHADHPAGS